MKSEQEIRAAIERCLEGCYRAASPVVKVAEFIETLRGEGWEPSDVRRVELLVLKILARLLSPTDDSKEREPEDLS